MIAQLSPLWYQYLSILEEDAPELVEEYIENTAQKLNMTTEYFTLEFI